MFTPSRRTVSSALIGALLFVALAGCNLPTAQTPPSPRTLGSARATLELEAIQPTLRLPAAPSRLETGPNAAALPHVHTAEEHFQAKRWRETIAAVNQALELDAQLTAARLMAARAAWAVGDSASAEAYLADLLKLDPRNAAAYWLRGEIALRNDQTEQAIQLLRLALLAGGEGCRSPECLHARLALGTALEREGYLAAAAEQLGAYLDADATTARDSSQVAGSEDAPAASRDRALRTLSEIYVRLGRQDKALEVCRRAVAERPREPLFRIRLSRLLLRAGQGEAAVDELIRLLTDLPSAYGDADSELAADSDQTRIRRLVELAKKRLDQHSDEPAALYLYARLLLQAREDQLAKKQLLAALALNGTYGPALVALAEMQIDERDWDSAAKSVAQALHSGIDDAHVYTLKGRVHDALDQVEETEAAWRMAFDRNRQSAEPLFLLAESMEHRAQRDKCRELYSRIIEEVDPNHAEAREKLFLFYLNANQIPKAKEVFAGFAKQGLSGPVVGRCRAMLNLAASPYPDGARRLATYQEDLRKVLAEYPQDASTLIALAMSNLAARDYQSALAEIDQAIEMDPGNVRAREFKTTLENKLLNFEEAARVVEDLIKDRPRDLGYQQRLLELAVTRADDEQAAAILNGLLAREDLADRRGVITTQLLEVLLSSKRFDEAVATAKKWRDESPADQSRQDTYVVALARAGRHDEAIGLIAQALADDPTNSRLRSRYITQLHAAKRFTEAQQQLLRWLASSPDDVDLNGLLISSFCAAKQWDNAIEVAKTGLELPEHHDAYEGFMAQACLLAGKYDDAIDAYRGILAKTQTEGALRDLITALIRAKRLPEAEQEVNKVLQPEFAKRDSRQSYDGVLILNMRRFLVRIYQLTGRSDQALQQLEEIHSLMVSDAEANNDFGYALADAGMRIDDAKRMITFAASERPNETAYMDSLGWVHYKLGDLEKAVYYLQLAVKKTDQDDPTILDHLGDACYRLNRQDEARKAWEKAAELTAPDRDPPPDSEDGALHQRVQAKLAALQGNAPPPISPLAPPQTSTQPATRPAT